MAPAMATLVACTAPAFNSSCLGVAAARNPDLPSEIVA